MNNSQKLVLTIGVLFFIGMALTSCTWMKSVPERVGEVYSLQSKVGSLRTYISPEPPIPTAERLQRKLGRPIQQSDINKWRENPTNPIMLVYDDYVVTVDALNSGSRIEVTDHTTAYSRHHSHFLYYWGPSWSPTVRRGNVNTWGGGPGRVQDGGIGGIGGK